MSSISSSKNLLSSFHLGNSDNDQQPFNHKFECHLRHNNLSKYPGREEVKRFYIQDFLLGK